MLRGPRLRRRPSAPPRRSPRPWPSRAWSWSLLRMPKCRRTNPSETAKTCSAWTSDFPYHDSLGAGKAAPGRGQVVVRIAPRLSRDELADPRAPRPWPSPRPGGCGWRRPRRRVRELYGRPFFATRDANSGGLERDERGARGPLRRGLLLGAPSADAGRRRGQATPRGRG